MPFGILDTQYIDFPANVDVAYLQGLQTRAGLNFAQVLALIDQRLAAFNGSLDELLADLLTPPTTEAAVDDASAIAFRVNERGEYTLARPQFAEGAGHMLPIRSYDEAIGFTEDGLESMSLRAILLQIDSMILGYRRLHRLTALTRLFSNVEQRVDRKTTITSPGFAGSGTGDNVFNRPYPNGTPLPGGYTHYYFADLANAGELETTMKAAIARLEIWYPGATFDLVGTQNAIDLVTGMTSFVQVGSALVRPGPNTAEALVDPGKYVGVFDGKVRVRKPLTEGSTVHLAIYVTFGPLAEGNPLSWRYDEIKGRNAYIRYRDFYPLSNAQMIQDFGIGVANRTAAALIYGANGATSYVNPTFT